MAITGAHVLVYSSETEKVRTLFRDVFKWPHVDAGEGWLIFRLPPAELGVHPDEEGKPPAGHLLSFMCDDIRATITELQASGIQVDGEPEDEGYGVTVMLSLPGDLKIMLYEPRHPVAIQMG